MPPDMLRQGDQFTRDNLQQCDRQLRRLRDELRQELWYVLNRPYHILLIPGDKSTFRDAKDLLVCCINYTLAAVKPQKGSRLPRADASIGSRASD